MIDLGEKYQDYLYAMRNGNPQHIRVTFMLDNMVFEDKDLTDECQITTYMNPDIDMTFGVAFSSEVNLAFIRSQKTNQLNFSREFKVEFGVEMEDETNWTQVGIFSGKRPMNDNNGVITLTAYDRMQRFDRNADDFLSLMTFPCTLQELYEALCAFVIVEPVSGDEIADVMSRTVASDFDKTGIVTCRDLLSMIAQANGCYARINPEGYLQLVWFENHRNDYTLTLDQVFNFRTTNLMQFDGKTWGELGSYTWGQLKYFKWKEFFNKITPFFISRILAKWTDPEDGTKQEVLHPPEGQVLTPMIWDDADQLTWDEFDEMIWDEVEGIERIGNIYTLEGNPFTHYSTEADIRSHLQLIINRIKHLNMYYVAAIDAVGNWILEAGDIIGLEVDGEIVPYPIFSRTLHWNGFCECEYESTGNIIRGEE